MLVKANAWTIVVCSVIVKEVAVTHEYTIIGAAIERTDIISPQAALPDRLLSGT